LANEHRHDTDQHLNERLSIVNEHLIYKWAKNGTVCVF